MRAGPSEKEEVISQVLFGELVQLLNQEGEWSEVLSPDRYSGWIYTSSLKKKIHHPTMFTSRNAVPVFEHKGIRQGPIITLPYGVGLEALNDSDWVEIRDIGFIERGNLSKKKILLKQELPNFSKRFLDIPYLWGGRSSFGYDCSGFIQMLYNQIGVNLPRDARLQFPLFSERQEIEAGDLIFWGESKEKIQHVGMYLGGSEFIHTSNQEQMPWVRVSSLNDSVWNPKTSPTYPFRSI